MDIEELVAIHRKWGYRIQKIDGEYFHIHGFRKSSFPPEKIIRPERQLLKALRWRSLVAPINFDASRKSYYEFLLDTDNYELEQFHKKERYCIRKSQKNCTFRRPEFDELMKDGLNINRQTLKRQNKRETTLSHPEKWKKHIQSVYNNDKFRILGVFYQDRMVGYLTLYKLGENYNMLHAFMDRNDSNETHPMAGLLYTAVNQIIEEEGRIRLSYGMHKFRGKSSLNNFKRNMLFESVGSARGYMINPLLIPIIKILVWYLLKVRNGHIPRKKWSIGVLGLYRGYRQLLKAAG